MWQTCKYVLNVIYSDKPRVWKGLKTMKIHLLAQNIVSFIGYCEIVLMSVGTKTKKNRGREKPLLAPSAPPKKLKSIEVLRSLQSNYIINFYKKILSLT